MGLYRKVKVHSIEDRDAIAGIPDLMNNRFARRARKSAARKNGMIVDGNATAAGMSRQADGKEAKDTVK